MVTFRYMVEKVEWSW